MITIRPSIASADPLALRQEMARLGQRADLHIDIEDGNYLQNITFGARTLCAVAAAAASPCDVHITARHPLRHIRAAAGQNVNAICFHLELASHPLECLHAIRAQGMRAGLALSFKTPLECLQMFTDDLDYLLLMTAEPDGEGERFHPAALRRIQRARAMLPAQAALFVDGGIGPEQFLPVLASGADTVIMGRSIWQAADPAQALAGFYALAKQNGF